MKKEVTSKGGPREGSGPKAKNELDIKMPATFYIKKRHLIKAKSKIQKIVDEINK